MTLEKKEIFYRNLAKGMFFITALLLGSLYLSEIAYAKFDIDAGVDAASSPLIKGVKDHWGKGVLLTGSAAALFGEGDGRQRAIRAGMAAGAAGAAILGMVALLT